MIYKTSVRMLLCLGLSFLLSASCGSRNDKGSGATAAPDKGSEATAAPFDPLSYLQDESNWTIQVGNKPKAAGLGNGITTYDYCTTWELDYEDHVLDLKGWVCAIRRPDQSLTDEDSSWGFVYVCDKSLGKYKLLCKEKDGPDWITLSSFEKIAVPVPETPAPHDSENTTPISSGSSAVTTPVSSGSSSRGNIDCASIEGAVLIANDGTTLGYILFSAYDSDSIFNKYGSFGSKYSATSIWNTYGQYGGKYSAMSPWNNYATSPPLLRKNGRTLCSLTVGNLSTEVCNTFEVASCFVSK